MQLKNTIKKYFTVWWIPLAAYLIPMAVYFLGNILRRDFVIDLSVLLFLINILLTFISAVVQIRIRKWQFIFPQFIISALLFFCFSFIFSFAEPDYYGAHKEIPSNIKVEIPLDREIINSDLSQNDFKLSSDSQPGMYKYYTNFQPKQKGHFYLKVFEITSNDRLSEDGINSASKINIDTLRKTLYSSDFTIYEGSWGDKYGGRIELWFKPENGKEFKLKQKNYIVEGWMR